MWDEKAKQKRLGAKGIVITAKDVIAGTLSVFAGMTLRDLFYTSYETISGEDENTPKPKKLMGRFILAAIALVVAIWFIAYML